MDYTAISDAQLLQLSQMQDWYTYELDFPALVHGTSAQNSFTVQTDSNFVWLQGMYWCENAASITGLTNSSLVVPLATIVLQDTSSGRQLMSAPVEISSIFGTGERPYILPISRFFRANTQLMATVSNYDSAINYNLKLSFVGMKRYTFQQSTP